ncbi:MAG: GNAT family N-acetyltransferase [Ruthenibacterium sp.]
MMTFIWIQAENAKIEDAFALRKTVFVDEQGFSPDTDRDEIDKTAWHIVGYDADGAPQCTARLFKEAEAVYHAGRIVVNRNLRGQGVGKKMLAEIAAKAQCCGAKTLRLGAQYDKAGFYEACGFTQYGDTYLDENYPHIHMQKNL